MMTMSDRDYRICPLGHNRCNRCGRLSALYQTWPSCDDCLDDICDRCDVVARRTEDERHRTRCVDCELPEWGQDAAVARTMIVIAAAALLAFAFLSR